MDEIERIEEERFVESLICLWIQPDAPKWIVDYVRQELIKQRGLLEDCNARYKAAAETIGKTENVVSGNCIVCGKQLNRERLFVCKECSTTKTIF